MLLLYLTWQCTAQVDQGHIVRDESVAGKDLQKLNIITKDTLPKGRIGLKSFTLLATCVP